MVNFLGLNEVNEKSINSVSAQIVPASVITRGDFVERVSESNPQVQKVTASFTKNFLGVANSTAISATATNAQKARTEYVSVITNGNAILRGLVHGSGGTYTTAINAGDVVSMIVQSNVQYVVASEAAPIGRVVQGSVSTLTNVSNETHTFTSIGATPTQLLSHVVVQDNANLIVVGTVLGEPYQFLKDTDYHINDSPADSTISWDSVTLPDDGTDFVVAYQYRGTADQYDLVSVQLNYEGAKPVPQNNLVQVTYNFAVNGGVKDVPIGLGVFIPKNAIVTRAYYDVITAFTSSTSTATISMEVQGTEDILGDAIISSVGTSGLHEGIEDGTMANAIKTNMEREVMFNITTQNLTAGKLNLYLEYVVSQ
jgi:hypothetical protein